MSTERRTENMLGQSSAEGQAIARMQCNLARKAKEQPEHKFQRLYRVICQEEWIAEALSRVLRNQGSRTGGVDTITRRWFEENPGRKEQLVSDLHERLQNGTYHPQPVRRKWIPKANGKRRPLGIPTIRDRVVQMLLKMILEPIYESDFLDNSIGFRPEHSTKEAIGMARKFFNRRQKYYWIIEGDIKGYFDNVQHAKLLEILQQRIADLRLIRLIRLLLEAGIMEGELFVKSEAGVPQGGIASPLLANIYLHEFDKWWQKTYDNPQEATKRPGKTTSRATARRKMRKAGWGNVLYLRYADDFILLTNGSKEWAHQVRELAVNFLKDKLGLELSMEKTHVTHIRDGFDFLGYHFQMKPTNPTWERHNQRVRIRKGTVSYGEADERLFMTPTERNVEKFKDKIRQATDRSMFCDPPETKFLALNALIRGWGAYYAELRNVRTSQLMHELDFWINDRVLRWLMRRHKMGIREALRCFKHQQGPRHNLAVPNRAKGNELLFLTRLDDVKQNRSKLPAFGLNCRPNPFLKEVQPEHTETDEAMEITELLENGWTGSSKEYLRHELRYAAREKAENKCQKCGKPLIAGEGDVHHKKARSRGGKDRLENTALLCEECHHSTASYGKNAT